MSVVKNSGTIWRIMKPVYCSGYASPYDGNIFENSAANGPSSLSLPYAKFGDPQTLNLYAYVENEPGWSTLCGFCKG